MFKNLDIELIREIKFNKFDEIEIIANSFENCYSIVFSKIINFSYSKDELLDIAENEIDVLEIVHKHCTPDKDDLKYYDYLIRPSGLTHKYHLVRIEGDTVIVILSREIAINKLD